MAKADNNAVADFQNLLHEILCNRRFASAEDIRKALLKDSRSEAFHDWIQGCDPRTLEVMHQLILKWNLGIYI